MNDFEIGCLVVVEAGRVVGILTERDVLKRVVDEGKKTRRNQSSGSHVQAASNYKPRRRP